MQNKMENIEPNSKSTNARVTSNTSQYSTKANGGESYGLKLEYL